MIKTPSDHLLDSLEELLPNDFEKFKFKLQNTSVEKDHSRIPRGQVQNAKPVKLANLMINHYGEENAVRLTLQVLRAINQNLLAEELDKAVGPGKQVPCPFLSQCNCWLFMGWGTRCKREFVLRPVCCDLKLRSPRSTMTPVTLTDQVLSATKVFGSGLV